MEIQINAVGRQRSNPSLLIVIHTYRANGDAMHLVKGHHQFFIQPHAHSFVGAMLYIYSYMWVATKLTMQYAILLSVKGHYPCLPHQLELYMHSTMSCQHVGRVTMMHGCGLGRPCNCFSSLASCLILSMVCAVNILLFQITLNMKV